MMHQKMKGMKGKTGEKKELQRFEAQTVLSELEDEGWQSLMVVWVAGSSYVEWEGLYTPLRVGEHLGLRREPENPYDALAIMVVDDNEEKLGYIPRDDNHELAQMLDDGKEFVAVILEVDLESPYQKLCIGVFEEDEKGESAS